MKQHLSVFCLMARSSFYKVFLLIFAMAIVQMFSFFQNFKNITSENIIPLEQIVDSSFISIPFFIALIGIISFLAKSTYSTKTVYTYSRLQISYGWIVFWKALYSFLCFLLLWMVQICLFIGFCQYYAENIYPPITGQQNIAMTFYLSGFMYSLCPLGNVIGFLDILLFALLLSGVAIVELPSKQNQLPSGYWAFWLIWILITPSSSGFPSHGIFITVVLSIVLIVVLGMTIYQLKHYKEEKYEAEDRL